MYFSEPTTLEGRVKLNLNLSNYETKGVLKNAIGINTSNSAKKVDLVNSKSNVDRLDINDLKSVPISLNNLKSKVDKSDIEKLVTVNVDLRKSCP